MRAAAPAIACLLLLAAPLGGVGSRAERVKLFPKLQAGQTFTYLIRYRNDKNIKTESAVVAPMAPTGAQLDAHGLLRVEVLEVQVKDGKPAIHVRSEFQTLDSGAWLKQPDQKNPEWRGQLPDRENQPVECTLLADGRVEQISGLESLSTEQQQAWQEWIARFTMTWSLPAEGMRRGEKWRSEEAERAAAPIAGLTWVQNSEYVRNEPCRAMRITVQGTVTEMDGPAENCAVVLMKATLKQKSSAKDATPEDYKLHQLRTAGTARGTNEIITYISLKTGLVVRATEEAHQAMDVVVALADGSNRVHYNVDAKSRSEVLLVAETPLKRP